MPHISLRRGYQTPRTVVKEQEEALHSIKKKDSKKEERDNAKYRKEEISYGNRMRSERKRVNVNVRGNKR